MPKKILEHSIKKQLTVYRKYGVLGHLSSLGFMADESEIMDFVCAKTFQSENGATLSKDDYQHLLLIPPYEKNLFYLTNLSYLLNQQGDCLVWVENYLNLHNGLRDQNFNWSVVLLSFEQQKTSKNEQWQTANIWQLLCWIIVTGNCPSGIFYFEDEVFIDGRFLALEKPKSRSLLIKSIDRSENILNCPLLNRPQCRRII